MSISVRLANFGFASLVALSIDDNAIRQVRWRYIIFDTSLMLCTSKLVDLVKLLDVDLCCSIITILKILFSYASDPHHNESIGKLKEKFVQLDLLDALDLVQVLHFREFFCLINLFYCCSTTWTTKMLFTLRVR
jgi:hypothetical protein